MSVQFSKIYHAYDESLNKAHTKSYRLSIQLATDGFSFALFNTLNSKFLSIESVELNAPDQPEEFISHFNHFVSEHPWMKADFEQTTILYESPVSTLIPGALYNPDDKDLLARFNFRVEAESTVMTDKLVNADAHLLYTIPQAIQSMLNRLFPGHSMQAHTTALIEEIMILNKNQPAGKRMFVNVRKGQLDVVIIEGKQLLFFNSFPYHSKQDFIYYIIFVIEQLNLNPEEIELKFSGKIDKASTLFDMAWKYIRNIQFQEYSATYRYSYVFNDVPSHRFFTLINSGMCVS